MKIRFHYQTVICLRQIRVSYVYKYITFFSQVFIQMIFNYRSFRKLYERNRIFI